MGKKDARRARSEAEIRLPDFQSPDEKVRADTVCGFCPCHAGWEKFENHVGDVLLMLRDRSRVVRAGALHVFADAARMQLVEELKLQLGPDEKVNGQKRAQHLPTILEKLNESTNRRIRKSKRRYRLEARFRKSKLRA
jgi:hypothetical protein